MFDLAKSVHWIVDESNDGVSIGSKRRRTRLGGDDSEEEDLPPPPANDIYRQRQQKRVKLIKKKKKKKNGTFIRVMYYLHIFWRKLIHVIIYFYIFCLF